MKRIGACGMILFLMIQAHPTSADDAAARMFRLAEELLHEGRVDQALETFAQVADGFPDSDLADDALLVLARKAFDPASPASLTRGDARAAAAAIDPLERILRRYPSSDGAAEAGYLMGMAHLIPGSPSRDLDEAFASFRGVIAVHPGAAQVLVSRLGCALAELQMGRVDAALLHLEALLLERPVGPLADRARLIAADAWLRQGDPWQATEVLLQVRSNGADPRVREEALDALTRLRRFDLPGLPAEGYEADPTYAISRLDLGGAIALRQDAAGLLHVLSDGGRTLSRFGPGGEVLDRSAVQEGRGLFLEPGGVVGWTSGDRAQASDGAVRFRRSDEKIPPLVAVAAGPDGSWAGIDERGREVLRFDADGGYRDALSIPGRAVDVDVDTRGNLWVLDAKSREVREFTADGSTRSVLSSPALAEPIQIRVDGAYHVHVLDRSMPGIVVFSLDGSILREWRFDRQGDDALRDPRAFEVDRSGGLLVFDGKTRRVRRFQ